MIFAETKKKSPHDRVVLENGVYHFGMLLPCNSNVGLRYSSHVGKLRIHRVQVHSIQS